VLGTEPMPEALAIIVKPPSFTSLLSSTMKGLPSLYSLNRLVRQLCCSTQDGPIAPHSHVQSFLIAFKVAETHEGRSLVLRKVAADARWVSTCACIKQHTELIIVDLVGVTTDSRKVNLHVDCQFKLCLDNLDKDIL